MTKVLILTNKNDITTDFVVKKLWDRGIPFYRFNTETLFSESFPLLDFENTRFEIYDSNSRKTIDLSIIESVYYRRPGVPSQDNEAFSQGDNNFIKRERLALLDGIYRLLDSAFWVSRVAKIRLAENKINQLILSRGIGFQSPPSLITSDPILAQNFFDKHKNVIVKPLKSGLIEDSPKDRVVFTTKVENLSPERVVGHPNYFQKQIFKKVDLRITIVGDKVFTAEIYSQDFEESQVDWRKGSAFVKCGRHSLPIEIEKKCIYLTKTLGLEFAAIDMVLDLDGNYWFLEINPNGQWAWLEKSLGFDISGEIVNLLCMSRK